MTGYPGTLRVLSRCEWQGSTPIEGTTVRFECPNSARAGRTLCWLHLGVRPTPAEWKAAHVISVAEAVGDGKPPIELRIAVAIGVRIVRGFIAAERFLQRVRSRK